MQCEVEFFDSQNEGISGRAKAGCVRPRTLARQASYPGSIFGQTAETITCFPLYELSPFERLLVTAKGDLQRIISSWCDEVVTVQVNYYDLAKKTQTENYYSRKVELKCRGKRFCIATSEIILSSKELKDALATKEVGIGQLFRRFSLCPQFTLSEVTRDHRHNLFSRKYCLKSDGIVCNIVEDFDAEQICSLEKIVIGEVLQQLDPKSEKDELLCVPLRYSSTEFSPFERVLLSAYDNVPRLVSSYLNENVEMTVSHSQRTTSNGFLRIANLLVSGKPFCVAKCEFTVVDEGLNLLLESGKFSLNDIFTKYKGGRLPKFKLESALKIKKQNSLPIDSAWLTMPIPKNSLYRKYTLATSFAIAHVQELFEPWIVEIACK
mmetsp:Transcript_4465/g.5525  ORF Transcript_4465/g.5525 Transcript_4465/m.5525 type:complete len:379 (+) Transcript_4465:122-1258(+)